MLPVQNSTDPELPTFVDAERLNELIDRAISEDIGSGDITSECTIEASAVAVGLFTAKAPGILAGLQVVALVFHRLDPDVTIEWMFEDGMRVGADTMFGRVRGSTKSILAGERLALNFLQRMSGIATLTGEFVEQAGPKTTILDTRKTAPGLRSIDKWAVLLGGGSNHRQGLFDMILIKDNHVSAAGGVKPALAAAHATTNQLGEPFFIEIEAKTLEEVREILDAGMANRILLDNMVSVDESGIVNTSMLRDALALIDGRIETEASGNVSLATVRQIGATGVDYISSGALTHSVTALDISLLLTS